MKQVIIINPNSDKRVTAALVQQAGALAPCLNFVGWTSPRGPRLIVDQTMLEASAIVVEEAVASNEMTTADAVIIGAIGDPGLRALMSHLSVPVTGIGHAAMNEVRRQAVPFVIATTTPALEGPLTEMVSRCGLSSLFIGMSYTAGDPIALGRDPDRLLRELGRACVTARKRGASAIVIGGGPLSKYASLLQRELDIRVIVPLEAAVARSVEILESSMPFEGYDFEINFD